MTQEKYLCWFRFAFPIDWVNENDHEVIELVFINARSNEEALFWGNKIAEKYIESLFVKNNYQAKTLGFTSFIWEDWQIVDDPLNELESFQIVNYGEYPVWDVEN